ncbi:MAG: hypothetical protein NC453_13070 [Muribaculum sp.]|nr:hypothetical protein [Muribaculum sp.]
MRQLSKIILAILVIIATLLVLDNAFGYVTDKLLFGSAQTKFDYAVNTSRNSDLVIFGSSRAENHYDTPFINDSLQINAFNLGEPGRGLSYHDAAIRAYLENHQPKVILLDLLADDLSGQINNRVKPLYPYIDKYPCIKNVAYNVDQSNKFYLKFKLLRLNSEIFDYIKKLRHPYNTNTLGYTPLQISSSYNDVEEKVYDSLTYKVNGVAKHCLIDIVNVCSEHDVKLVVVYSPEYAIRNYKIPITEVCDSLDVTVINDLGFRLNMDAREYFYDNRHLNKIGAREYSRHIINKLKSDSIL